MPSAFTKTKYSYLDLLRLFAIIAVLFTHTGLRGMYLYTSQPHGPLRGLYLFASSLADLQIPLFLMCSGALLLKKNESIPQLLLHRVLRFAIVLVLMQAFNYYYLFRNDLSRIYLEHYVRVLFSDLFAAHLWYLYSYVAYLLMLPFMRRMVSAMEKKDYYYLFAIYLFFRCTELIQLFIFKDSATINPDFKVSFFAALDIFFYPMLGHYLHNILDIKTVDVKKFSILIAAALLSTVAGIVLTELRMAWTGTDNNAFKIFRFITGAALFVGCKLLFDRYPCNVKLARLLATAGNCIFGVYLFENVLRDQTVWIYNILIGFLPPLCACLVWLIAATALGVCIIYILKKIPLVKEIL